MSNVWKSQKTTGLCRYLSVGRVLGSVITLYMYALRIWCSVSGHDTFKVMCWDLQVSQPTNNLDNTRRVDNIVRNTRN